ncbi:transcription factor [Anaeramoeba flamelloides]|uniref:Transcription factor n=1 Tax=Anaeramoeba flamelloides TaxID=1746091 RepID=A0AAV7ZHH8_9EUKA|nr:transcription factor [Anaeramoeba flamelloides]
MSSTNESEEETVNKTNNKPKNHKQKEKHKKKKKSHHKKKRKHHRKHRKEKEKAKDKKKDEGTEKKRENKKHKRKHKDKNKKKTQNKKEKELEEENKDLKEIKKEYEETDEKNLETKNQNQREEESADSLDEDNDTKEAEEEKEEKDEESDEEKVGVKKNETDKKKKKKSHHKKKRKHHRKHRKEKEKAKEKGQDEDTEENKEKKNPKRKHKKEKKKKSHHKTSRKHHHEKTKKNKSKSKKSHKKTKTDVLRDKQNLKELEAIYDHQKREIDKSFCNILMNLYDKLEEICKDTYVTIQKDIGSYQVETENLKKELKKYTDFENSLKILNNDIIDDKYQYIKLSMKLDELVNQDQDNKNFGSVKVLPLLGYYLNISNICQEINGITSRPKIDFKLSEIQLLTKTSYALFDTIKFKVILKNFKKQIITDPLVDCRISDDQSNEIIKYQNAEYCLTEKAIILSALVSKIGKHTITVKIKSKFTEENGKCKSKSKKKFTILVTDYDLSNSWKAIKCAKFEKEDSIVTSRSDEKIRIYSKSIIKKEKSYRFCLQILKSGNFEFGIQAIYCGSNKNKLYLCKMIGNGEEKEQKIFPIGIEINENAKEDEMEKELGEQIQKETETVDQIYIENSCHPIGIEINENNKVDGNGNNLNLNLNINDNVVKDNGTNDVEQAKKERILFVQQNDKIEMIVNNSKSKFIKWTNLTTQKSITTRINYTANYFKLFLNILKKNTSINFVSANLNDPNLK